MARRATSRPPSSTRWGATRPGRRAPPGWRSRPSRRSSRPCSGCSSRSRASRDGFAVLTHGPYARSVLASKPLAYWRLDDIQGPVALDSSGHDRHARYEGGVAFYLPGPDAAGLSAGKPINRAVYFAGGRLKAELDGLPETYTVELWFWNGLPNDARPITGVLFCRRHGVTGKSSCVNFGIGGTRIAPEPSLLQAEGDDRRQDLSPARPRSRPRPGTTSRSFANGQRVTVYLDGKLRARDRLDVEFCQLKGHCLAR